MRAPKSSAAGQGDPPPQWRSPTFGQLSVRRFLDWAHERECLPGAARILALVDPHEPLLLGGLTRFIGRGHVIELLQSWVPEAEALAPVTELALKLWTGDDARASLPAPDPAERMDRAFRGKLANYPVAVMCAAGQPPGTEYVRIWIDQLRAFVLAVQLIYVSAGNLADRHVSSVARNLRLACDDPASHRLLAWFASLQCEASSLNRLSDVIAVRCEKRASEARRAKTPPRPLLTALAAVARRRELPGPRSVPPLELGPGPAAAVDSNLPGWDLQLQEETTALIVAGDEDETLVAVAEVEEGSPGRAVVAARGVLLESVEALNFLPYSWERTPVEETQALFAWISSLLAAEELRDRVLGAIAAIAVATGNSMQTVGRVPIGGDASDDWTLDLNAGALRRRPARRGSRWRAQEKSASWVRPLSQEWTLSLVGPIRKLLRSVRGGEAAGDVKALWRLVADEPLDTAFNRSCRIASALGRVSSGHLRRVAQTALFRVTDDAPFSRVAVAATRTGLPGACAYPAWTARELGTAWNRALPDAWFASVRFGASQYNALGSELDPVDDLLRTAIGELLRRVNDAGDDPLRWAERHNALVCYVVLALLAATGARPVDSPFESPAHFDWRHGFVFIDDKAFARDESGRVVPLAPSAQRLVEQGYLPHLSSLSVDLERVAPELAGELARLADRRAARLPFFFFVRSSPSISWISVSPGSLDAHAQIGWPLPWNLMRHRLATRLRARHVDPEIIDGVLGHAEAGAATWGDESLRTWERDAAGVAPALEAEFQRLGFGMPRASAPRARIDGVSVDRLFGEKTRFGTAARRAQRSVDHRRAQLQARREIDLALGKRALNELPPEELDALGRSMILNARGLPHPYADLRYAQFERRLAQAWRGEAGKPRLRRHAAFAFETAARSPFRPESAVALGTRAATLRAISGLGAPQSWRSPTQAAAIASVLACVVARITDPTVLEAVAARRGIALAVLGGSAWLEFRVGEDGASPPVTRFPLDTRTAAWIDRALSGQRAGLPATDIPAELKPLAALFGNVGAVPALRKAIAGAVSQANALQLPGVVAAWLDGRMASWALPPHDWVRFATGMAARFPATRSQPADPLAAIALPLPRAAGGPFDRRVELARCLVAEVRRLLAEYRDGNPRGADDTAARRDLRRRLARAARNADPDTPSAVVALVAWVVDLLERRPAKPHFLRPSSVQRYLDALAPAFVDHLYDLDLADLEPEEIGESYAAMLVAYGDAGHDPGYVAQRLQEFHRFAERAFGLETPDWSEVLPSARAVSGAPGTVLRAEYLHALRSLVPHPERADRATLCAGMLLLLAFRFGLRGREAQGLMRADWCDHFRASVVLVRPNAVRALKSPAARRQVPLLAQLEAFEELLIARWLATWEALAGERPQLPLFALDGAGTLSGLRVLRERTRQALCLACRAPYTTLHHARHAFANEVFLALLPAESRPALAAERCFEPEHLQALLVGGTRPTRRSLWALARALGHARPSTTLRSYVHALPDIAAAALRPESAGGTTILWRPLCALNFDRLRADPEYLRPLEASAPPATTASLAELVRAARLLAKGWAPERAAFSLAIDDDPVRRLRAWFAGADRRMQRSARDPDATAPPRARTLLGMVLGKRWDVLVDLAGRAAAPGHVPALDESLHMLGPARQLLAWREGHFAAIASLLDGLGLREDVVLYETDALAPQLAGWAQANGFVARRRQCDDHGTRVFQIDGVVDGDPPQRIVHRCAAARASGAARLRSSAELLVLWGCYFVWCSEPQRDHASSSSVTSSPASSTRTSSSPRRK